MWQKYIVKCVEYDALFSMKFHVAHGKILASMVKLQLNMGQGLEIGGTTFDIKILP